MARAGPATHRAILLHQGYGAAPRHRAARAKLDGTDSVRVQHRLRARARACWEGGGERGAQRRERARDGFAGEQGRRHGRHLGAARRPDTGRPGVATAPALKDIAKRLNVDMPICTAMANILSGDLDVDSAIIQLLSREHKSET